MNLIDCVESLSTHTLQKILQHHRPYTILSEEGSTLSFLHDQEYLKNLWEKMSSNEQYVLVSFLAHIHDHFLSYSKLTEAIDLPIGDLLVGLTLIRQKGLVYTHRRYLGEIAYFIPEDLRVQLLRLFVNKEASSRHQMDQVHIQPPIFYEDLWNLLHYIRFNPLQLTQKGSIHKRQLQRLESLIEPSLLAISKMPLNYDGSDQYSKAVALYLDFAVHYDLIGESEDQLHICVEQVLAWLSYSGEELLQYLWDYIREKVVGFYTVEMRLLLDWLYLQPIGQWIEWKSFLNFIKLLRHDPIPFSNVIGLDLVHSLQSLGLICIIENEGNWWIGRPKAFEYSESFVYIQPNLELLVPLALPMKLRWQIGEFAELRQRDQMITYEITKNSIERAVEIGWDETKLYSFLCTISLNVPENVRMMLRNWIEASRKLQFMDVMVLECSDESLMSEIIQQPIFAPYIYRPLSSRHLIIARAKLSEFRQKLEQAGYSPMRKITYLDEDVIKKIHAARPILNVNIRSTPRVENIYPELEEAFPGVHTIPKSWLNTYRTYHPSSLIDVIKRAKQYHLKLSFRLVDETEVKKVNPIALNPIGGDYMLNYSRQLANQGKVEKWVSLKEIKEVAVHLPF